MAKYRIKTVFQIKPDVHSDEIIAEFENDEIETNDKYDWNLIAENTMKFYLS